MKPTTESTNEMNNTELQNIIIDALKNLVAEVVRPIVREEMENEDLDVRIERAMNDYDFSDEMEKVVNDHDFDYNIERAISDHDFEPEVKDIIHSMDPEEVVDVDRVADILVNTEKLNDAIDNRIAAALGGQFRLVPVTDTPQVLNATLGEGQQA
jgi:hypothetical protein